MGSHNTGDDPECEFCAQTGRSHAVINLAEHFGGARCIDGMLQIGTPDENGEGVVFIPYRDQNVDVYVRRISDDLSVYEIAICRGDGLAQEVLNGENFEAERYPLGPKEYWRGKMVGAYSVQGEPMTDADFEEYWAEGDA